MRTRSDYMNDRCTHREYYADVAAAAGVEFPPDHELVMRSRAALQAGDEHLNTIPLKTWDAWADTQRASMSRALKERGDFWSLAAGVCVAKEAAKQAAEIALPDLPICVKAMGCYCAGHARGTQAVDEPCDTRE